jgi:hypothetical protein
MSKNKNLYLLPTTFMDVVRRCAIQLLVCRLYLDGIFIVPCYKMPGLAYDQVLVYSICWFARSFPYTVLL